MRVILTEAGPVYADREADSNPSRGNRGAHFQKREVKKNDAKERDELALRG